MELSKKIGSFLGVIWAFLVANAKAFFKNIFAPEEYNGVMFYYGALIYLMANVFVKDFVAIFTVAVVVGIILAYRRFMLGRKVTWLNFVFGMATTLFTSIQIWL